jgi:hypothetical protein
LSYGEDFLRIEVVSDLIAQLPRSAVDP